MASKFSDSKSFRLALESLNHELCIAVKEGNLEKFMKSNNGKLKEFILLKKAKAFPDAFVGFESNSFFWTVTIGYNTALKRGTLNIKEFTAKHAQILEESNGMKGGHTAEGLSGTTNGTANATASRSASEGVAGRNARGSAIGNAGNARGSAIGNAGRNAHPSAGRNAGNARGSAIGNAGGNAHPSAGGNDVGNASGSVGGNSRTSAGGNKVGDASGIAGGNAGGNASGNARTTAGRNKVGNASGNARVSAQESAQESAMTGSSSTVPPLLPAIDIRITGHRHKALGPAAKEVQAASVQSSKSASRSSEQANSHLSGAGIQSRSLGAPATSKSSGAPAIPGSSAASVPSTSLGVQPPANVAVSGSKPSNRGANPDARKTKSKGAKTAQTSGATRSIIDIHHDLALTAFETPDSPQHSFRKSQDGPQSEKVKKLTEKYNRAVKAASGAGDVPVEASGSEYQASESENEDSKSAPKGTLKRKRNPTPPLPVADDPDAHPISHMTPCDRCRDLNFTCHIGTKAVCLECTIGKKACTRGGVSVTGRKSRNADPNKPPRAPKSKAANSCATTSQMPITLDSDSDQPQKKKSRALAPTPGPAPAPSATSAAAPTHTPTPADISTMAGTLVEKLPTKGKLGKAKTLLKGNQEVIELSDGENMSVPRPSSLPPKPTALSNPPPTITSTPPVPLPLLQDPLFHDLVNRVSRLEIQPAMLPPPSSNISLHPVVIQLLERMSLLEDRYTHTRQELLDVNRAYDELKEEHQSLVQSIRSYQKLVNTSERVLHDTQMKVSRMARDIKELDGSYTVLSERLVDTERAIEELCESGHGPEESYGEFEEGSEFGMSPQVTAPNSPTTSTSPTVSMSPAASPACTPTASPAHTASSARARTVSPAPAPAQSTPASPNSTSASTPAPAPATPSAATVSPHVSASPPAPAPTVMLTPKSSQAPSAPTAHVSPSPPSVSISHPILSHSPSNVAQAKQHRGDLVPHYESDMDMDSDSSRND